jgi:hypothetical protein
LSVCKTSCSLASRLQHTEEVNTRVSCSWILTRLWKSKLTIAFIACPSKPHQHGCYAFIDASHAVLLEQGV